MHSVSDARVNRKKSYALASKTRVSDSQRRHVASQFPQREISLVTVIPRQNAVYHHQPGDIPCDFNSLIGREACRAQNVMHMRR
jgi:hypothetical protein